MPPSKASKARKSTKARKRPSSGSSSESKSKGEGTNVRKFRLPGGGASTQLVVPGVEGSELSDLPDGAVEIDAGTAP